MIKVRIIKKKSLLLERTDWVAQLADGNLIELYWGRQNGFGEEQWVANPDWLIGMTTREQWDTRIQSDWEVVD